jgi:hypothetical protein
MSDILLHFSQWVVAVAAMSGHAMGCLVTERSELVLRSGCARRGWLARARSGEKNVRSVVAC